MPIKNHGKLRFHMVSRRHDRATHLLDAFVSRASDLEDALVRIEEGLKNGLFARGAILSDAGLRGLGP